MPDIRATAIRTARRSGDLRFDGHRGSGEGVYVEATAAALVIPAEIHEATMNLARRAGKDIGPELRRLDAGIQPMYRATPSRVWINSFESDSDGRFVRDVRVEIPVSCLAGLVGW